MRLLFTPWLVIVGLSVTAFGIARVKRDDIADQLQSLADLIKALQTLQKDQGNTQQCSPGWEFFDGFCYKFNSTAVPYDEAEASCKRDSSTGISILNENEQQFIHGNIKGSQKSFWLGFKPTYGIGSEWVWIDGSKKTYSNWETKEPWFLFGASANSMKINGETGKWHYTAKTVPGGIACKKRASPQPIKPQPSQNMNDITAQLQSIKDKIAALLAKQKGQGNTQQCSPGWEFFDRFCYKIVPTAVSYDEAKATCHRESSTVISITSEKEQEFILGRTLKEDQTWYWIGLLGKTGGYDWNWTDESANNYMNLEKNLAGYEATKHAFKIDGKTGKWYYMEKNVLGGIACKKRART